MKRLYSKLRIQLGDKKYLNLSLEDYNELLEAQSNKCAICKDKFGKVKNRLHIDHCHSTMAIRGLLCGRCNTGLGMFKDDISTLESAIKYLDRSRRTYP